MRKRMKLYCDDKEIYPQIHENEQLSMLITGRSRMGKTYFASCLGGELIDQGETVHLIDLGDKWSAADKSRLLSAGAVKKQIDEEGMSLTFNSVRDAGGCGRIIANALGFRSAGAVMVLKQSISQLLTRHGQRFTFRDLLECLESSDEELAEDREWQLKVWERLDSVGEIPHIVFCLDEDKDFSTGSVIWDLSGLDDTNVQVLAYLISFCLLCQQKRKFRNGDTSQKIFVMIDEFQSLDCNKRSIIGTCLAEGQKYGMALILITQFLNGNFNEAVVQQFKQGGFRFYFRLTEEEAAAVSWEMSRSGGKRDILYRKLTTLPRGHCLMLGPHYIEGNDRVTEVYRFVEIRDM